MADENKIEIEIVLNDGSIQKGFVKLETLAAETARKIKEDFDKNKPTEDLPAKGEQSFGDLYKIATSTFGKIAISATASFAIVKRVLDTTFQGENVQRIENQFKALSEQAGQSSEVLKERFGKALGGLADESAGLQAINRALIQTDVTAGKLPELFTIAKERAKIFGADAIESFEKLTSAIASTSTRRLRELGIIIDSEKAQKKYADSLGIGVEFLSLEGKQQAILNEVLRIGQERHISSGLAVESATISYKKLSSSVQNFIDNSAKATASSFGPTFARLFDELSLAVDKFSNSMDKSGGTIPAQTNVIEKQIKSLNNTLKDLKEQQDFQLKIHDDGAALVTANNIKIVSKELDGLTKQLTNLGNIQAAQNEEAKKRGTEGGDKAAIDSIRNRSIETEKFNQARIKSEQEVANQFRSIAVQNINTAIEETALIGDEEERRKQVKGLKLAENYIQEQSALDQLAIAQKANLENGLIDEQTYQELRTAIHSEFSQKRLDIENDTLKRRQKIVDDANASINNALRSGFVQTLSATFQRLGASLIQGGNAFKDFGKVILGILGDIAINMGTTIVTASTAIQALKASIFGNAAPGIAAGLALIALGGLLKALGGNDLGTPAAAGGAGGGGVSGGGFESSGSLASNQEVQKPGQQVAVNIQGNVFDTKETGLRIVDILNQSFQNEGTTLVTGNA